MLIQKADLPMHLPKFFRPLPATLAACLLAGAAQAETVSTRYGVSMLGLTIGTATVSGKFDGGTYRVDANTKVSGLAAMMSSSKGSAAATGAFGKGGIAPSTYATTSANANVTRTVRMAINGGTVKALDISPPFEDKPGRVPLTEDSQRGIVDPLSAVLMAIPADQPLVGPTVCNRTIPVFDGYARFNVVLSYSGTRQVKAKGYSGPVSVCSARYVPLAGHRPDRPATKFMINNRQIEVWLAPLEQSHIAIPFRIAVQTQVGMLVIEAQEMSVDSAGQAKAQ